MRRAVLVALAGLLALPATADAQRYLAFGDSITNGTGSQSCSAGSTSWGACTVTGCNSGYTQSGNSCVSANPCQTGPFQRVPGCSCGTRRDCEGFDTYTNRGTYCEVKRVGCLCVTTNQYCP